MLLVEDDSSIREVATLGLEQAGLKVTAIGDGREGLARFREGGVDLVVLDVMLPSLDGFEVCREIRRESGAPIVMLTARSELHDIVVGLELGADDYITKPFELPELVARVKAVLRRASPPDGDGTISIGGLEIDPGGFTVRKRGEELSLTATAYKLLLTLVERRGRVQTRPQLLETVWEAQPDIQTRTVDMHVQRLRTKLGECGRMIETVRGFGYRFRSAEKVGTTR